MFAKYIQLYARVSDAEKTHDDMGPYPVSWENPFDSGEPLDHGTDKRGWGQYAIWDASTKDMEEKAARGERQKIKEQNVMNGAQFEFGVKLHKFKDEVGEAMTGYCGAAFDLFADNDERDAIITENVADVSIRKVLEERLDWVRGIGNERAVSRGDAGAEEGAEECWGFACFWRAGRAMRRVGK